MPGLIKNAIKNNMIEVKNIVFIKSRANLIKSFCCFVNHLLPLRMKFQNETFSLLLNNKVLGTMTLDKDAKSHTRFKITKLILEENSALVSKQLVNYVITRYRAMGAAQFYVVADEKEAQLLNIFKNELNFRFCGCEYLYKINLNDLNYGVILKPLKNEQINNVCTFYNENINSFNKMLFSRQNYQFKNKCIKYIFKDEEKEKLLGYFEVLTKNNFDFYINFSIDFAYNIYLMDAIKFINSKIKQKHKKFNLYVKVKDYFMNSRELIAILNENNTQLISKGQILAKDYYKEIKETNIFKNTKIIFNDPTTA